MIMDYENDYLNSQISLLTHHLFNFYNAFDVNLLNSIINNSDTNNLSYNKILYGKLCYFLQLANNINEGIVISNMNEIDNLNIPEINVNEFDDKTLTNYNRKYFKVLFDLHDINYIMYDSDED